MLYAAIANVTGGFTGESWYACQTFMQSMMTIGEMLAPWSFRPRRRWW